VHHDAQSPEGFRVRRRIILRIGQVDRQLELFDRRGDASRPLVVASVAQGACGSG